MGAPVARPPQVVIFPDLRISKLEAEVEEKRRALSQSRAALTAAWKRKWNPVTFLWEHPKILGGILAALWSSPRLFRFGGRTTRRLVGSKFLLALLASRWGRAAAKGLLAYGLRRLAPALFGLLRVLRPRFR